MYPNYVPHWIADVEVVPKDSTTFEKRNPATDKVIAQVARGGSRRDDWYLGFNISRKFY